MADPYSRQEIDELRSPAVSWQYLDARRVVATWDELLAEQQATIERLRSRLPLPHEWNIPAIKEAALEYIRSALDTTQHEGQVLREVRAEALDGSIKVEHHCGRYALMVNGHGIVIEGDVCRSDKMTQRTWTRDMLRQVVRDNPYRQPHADHPTTTTTDEEG